MWNPSANHFQHLQISPPSPTSGLIARSKEIVQMLDAIAQPNPNILHDADDQHQTQPQQLQQFRAVLPYRPHQPSTTASTRAALPPLYNQQQSSSANDENLSMVSSSSSSSTSRSHHRESDYPDQHHQQIHQQLQSMLVSMSKSQPQQQLQQPTITYFKESREIQVCERDLLRGPSSGSLKNACVQTDTASTSTKSLMTESTPHRSCQMQTDEANCAHRTMKDVGVEANQQQRPKSFTSSLTQTTPSSSRPRTTTISTSTAELDDVEFQNISLVARQTLHALEVFERQIIPNLIEAVHVRLSHQEAELKRKIENASAQLKLAGASLIAKERIRQLKISQLEKQQHIVELEQANFDRVVDLFNLSRSFVERHEAQKKEFEKERNLMKLDIVEAQTATSLTTTMQQPSASVSPPSPPRSNSNTTSVSPPVTERSPLMIPVNDGEEMEDAEDLKQQIICPRNYSRHSLLLPLRPLPQMIIRSKQVLSGLTTCEQQQQQQQQSSRSSTSNPPPYWARPTFAASTTTKGKETPTINPLRRALIPVSPNRNRNMNQQQQQQEKNKKNERNRNKNGGGEDEGEDDDEDAFDFSPHRKRDGTSHQALAKAVQKLSSHVVDDLMKECDSLLELDAEHNSRHRYLAVS